MAKILTDGIISVLKKKIPKLYSTFGTNTDGAVTQDFIRSTLVGGKLQLGATSASATGASSIALGEIAKASGSGAVAIGAYSEASGDYAAGIGQQAEATGDFSASLLGMAYGEYGTAIGNGSVASEERSTAIGTGANATAVQATALGEGAYATASGAVAIGNGSLASEPYTVAVGSGFLVNGTRRIVNVADGVKDTDAATVGQVKSMSGGGGGGASGKGINLRYTSMSAPSIRSDNSNFTLLTSLTDMPAGSYFIFLSVGANIYGLPNNGSGSGEIQLCVNSNEDPDTSNWLGYSPSISKTGSAEYGFMRPLVLDSKGTIYGYVRAYTTYISGVFSGTISNVRLVAIPIGQLIERMQ